MNAFLNFLLSDNVISLLVSSVIFLITILLVVYQKIGFFMTVLFLAFSILAGLAVNNHDVIRDYVNKGKSQAPINADAQNKTSEQEKAEKAP